MEKILYNTNNDDDQKGIIALNLFITSFIKELKDDKNKEKKQLFTDLENIQSTGQLLNYIINQEYSQYVKIENEGQLLDKIKDMSQNTDLNQSLTGFLSQIKTQIFIRNQQIQNRRFNMTEQEINKYFIKQIQNVVDGMDIKDVSQKNFQLQENEKKRQELLNQINIQRDTKNKEFYIDQTNIFFDEKRNLMNQFFKMTDEIQFNLKKFIDNFGKASKQQEKNRIKLLIQKMGRLGITGDSKKIFSLLQIIQDKKDDYEQQLDAFVMPLSQQVKDVAAEIIQKQIGKKIRVNFMQTIISFLSQFQQITLPPAPDRFNITQIIYSLYQTNKNEFIQKLPNNLQQQFIINSFLCNNDDELLDLLKKTYSQAKNFASLRDFVSNNTAQLSIMKDILDGKYQYYITITDSMMAQDAFQQSLFYKYYISNKKQMNYNDRKIGAVDPLIPTGAADDPLLQQLQYVINYQDATVQKIYKQIIKYLYEHYLQRDQAFKLLQLLLQIADIKDLDNKQFYITLYIIPILIQNIQLVYGTPVDIRNAQNPSNNLLQPGNTNMIGSTLYINFGFIQTVTDNNFFLDMQSQIISALYQTVFMNFDYISQQNKGMKTLIELVGGKKESSNKIIQGAEIFYIIMFLYIRQVQQFFEKSNFSLKLSFKNKFQQLYNYMLDLNKEIDQLSIDQFLKVVSYCNDIWESSNASTSSKTSLNDRTKNLIKEFCDMVINNIIYKKQTIDSNLQLQQTNLQQTKQQLLSTINGMSPESAFIDTTDDMIIEDKLGDYNDLVLPNQFVENDNKIYNPQYRVQEIVGSFKQMISENQSSFLSKGDINEYVKKFYDDVRYMNEENDKSSKKFYVFERFKNAKEDLKQYTFYEKFNNTFNQFIVFLKYVTQFIVDYKSMFIDENLQVKTEQALLINDNQKLLQFQVIILSYVNLRDTQFFKQLQQINGFNNQFELLINLLFALIHGIRQIPSILKLVDNIIDAQVNDQIKQLLLMILTSQQTRQVRELYKKIFENGAAMKSNTTYPKSLQDLSKDEKQVMEKLINPYIRCRLLVETQNQQIFYLMSYLFYNYFLQQDFKSEIIFEKIDTTTQTYLTLDETQYYIRGGPREANMLFKLKPMYFNTLQEDNKFPIKKVLLNKKDLQDFLNKYPQLDFNGTKINFSKMISEIKSQQDDIYNQLQSMVFDDNQKKQYYMQHFRYLLNYDDLVNEYSKQSYIYITNEERKVLYKNLSIIEGDMFYEYIKTNDSVYSSTIFSDKFVQKIEIPDKNDFKNQTKQYTYSQYQDLQNDDPTNEHLNNVKHLNNIIYEYIKNVTVDFKYSKIDTRFIEKLLQNQLVKQSLQKTDIQMGDTLTFSLPINSFIIPFCVNQQITQFIPTLLDDNKNTILKTYQNIQNPDETYNIAKIIHLTNLINYLKQLKLNDLITLIDALKNEARVNRIRDITQSDNVIQGIQLVRTETNIPLLIQKLYKQGFLSNIYQYIQQLKAQQGRLLNALVEDVLTTLFDTNNLDLFNQFKTSLFNDIDATANADRIFYLKYLLFCDQDEQPLISQMYQAQFTNNSFKQILDKSLISINIKDYKNRKEFAKIIQTSILPYLLAQKQLDNTQYPYFYVLNYNKLKLNQIDSANFWLIYSFIAYQKFVLGNKSYENDKAFVQLSNIITNDDIVLLQQITNQLSPNNINTAAFYEINHNNNANTLRYYVDLQTYLRDRVILPQITNLSPSITVLLDNGMKDNESLYNIMLKKDIQKQNQGIENNLVPIYYDQDNNRLIMYNGQLIKYNQQNDEQKVLYSTLVNALLNNQNDIQFQYSDYIYISQFLYGFIDKYDKNIYYKLQNGNAQSVFQKLLEQAKYSLEQMKDYILKSDIFNQYQIMNKKSLMYGGIDSIQNIINKYILDPGNLSEENKTMLDQFKLLYYYDQSYKKLFDQLNPFYKNILKYILQDQNNLLSLQNQKSYFTNKIIREDLIFQRAYIQSDNDIKYLFDQLIKVNLSNIDIAAIISKYIFYRQLGLETKLQKGVIDFNNKLLYDTVQLRQQELYLINNQFKEMLNNQLYDYSTDPNKIITINQIIQQTINNKDNLFRNRNLIKAASQVQLLQDDPNNQYKQNLQQILFIDAQKYEFNIFQIVGYKPISGSNIIKTYMEFPLINMMSNFYKPQNIGQYNNQLKDILENTLNKEYYVQNGQFVQRQQETVDQIKNQTAQVKLP